MHVASHLRPEVPMDAALSRHPLDAALSLVVLELVALHRAGARTVLQLAQALCLRVELTTTGGATRVRPGQLASDGAGGPIVGLFGSTDSRAFRRAALAMFVHLRALQLLGLDWSRHFHALERDSVLDVVAEVERRVGLPSRPAPSERAWWSSTTASACTLRAEVALDIEEAARERARTAPSSAPETAASEAA